MTSAYAQNCIFGFSIFNAKTGASRDMILNTQHISQITRNDDSNLIEFYTRDELFTMEFDEPDAIKKITQLMTTCQIKIGKESPFQKPVKVSSIPSTGVNSAGPTKKKIH